MCNMPRMKVAALKYGCNLNDISDLTPENGNSSLLINEFVLPEVAEDNEESELQ